MKTLILFLVLTLTAFGIDAPKGYVFWKRVRAKVTGYCPCVRCCGKYADGKTATGSNAWKPNGCAVDKRAIPYGTMVWIPGYGFRIADDTGSAMRRSWRRRRKFHVDVRTVYHWEARKVGNDTVTIILFRKEMEAWQRKRS